MGGNYPMPTLISKGEVLVRIDEYYELVDGRLRSLYGFQQAGNYLEALKNNGVLSDADIAHLRDDWFTVGSGFWVTLQKNGAIYEIGEPSKAALEGAQRAFKTAFEYALSISLGLAPGEAVPMTDGKIDREKIKKHRRRELKVYWVCGKADGFEAQVVWSRRQVDLFLITPPISFPVGPLAQFRPEQVVVHDGGQEGMVLVTATPDGSRVQHVAEMDGGIAYGGIRVRPGPFPAPTDAGLAFAADVVLDDPAGRIGRPNELTPLGEAIANLIEEYIRTELQGLDDKRPLITHVTVGDGSAWLRVRVSGVHRQTTPGRGTFLGWWATDNEVDFPIAFRFAFGEKEATLDEAIWDRQNVHGQLGVRAVGRPILR